MSNQLMSTTFFEGIIHLKQKHNETLQHAIGVLKCFVGKILQKSEERFYYDFMYTGLGNRKIEVFTSTL